MLLLGLVVMSVSFSSVVKATNHGYVWQKTSETPCNPKCGEQGATHEVTYTCFDGEGHAHDECSIETVYDSCPQGYSVFFTTSCIKNSYPYNVISRPSHKEPETKTVTEDCRVSEEDVIACEPVCEEGFYMTENGCEANRVPEPPRSIPNTDPTAFMCPNGQVTALPFNFNVTRQGDKAILQWIPTGGDQVNIYLLDAKTNALIGSKPDQPNNGYAVVDHLNPNVGYTFELEQKQGCGGGVRVGVVDGPISVLFRQSYVRFVN